jgi:hypothetical protein
VDDDEDFGPTVRFAKHKLPEEMWGLKKKCKTNEDGTGYRGGATVIKLQLPNSDSADMQLVPDLVFEFPNDDARAKLPEGKYSQSLGFASRKKEDGKSVYEPCTILSHKHEEGGAKVSFADGSEASPKALLV